MAHISWVLTHLMRPLRSRLITNLDTKFSQYIRSKDADWRGNVKCYTCGVEGHWRNFDAGHYIGRANVITRWDEMNVKPQCKQCNKFGSPHLTYQAGEQETFKAHLIQDYGPQAVENLLIKSRSGIKVPTFEIQELLEEYSQKLTSLTT